MNNLLQSRNRSQHIDISTVLGCKGREKLEFVSS